MTLPLKNAALLRQQAFINGEWCAAANGQSHTVTNPSTGDRVGDVPDMGAVETSRAIDAAAAAQPAWSGLTAKARATALRKWFELILAHQEDLAQLMTSEQGKPLAEARKRRSSTKGR